MEESGEGGSRIEGASDDGEGAASYAVAEIETGQGEQELAEVARSAGVARVFERSGTRCGVVECLREQGAGGGELCVDVAGGEQAVMANLGEAFGEDVEDEASKKLVGRESDLRRTACAKGDAVLVEGDEAVIADADTMGVLAEVAKDLLLVAEGRLAVDDPPDTLELVAESPEAVVIGEGGGGPVEVEPPFAVSEAHCIEELSAEELPEGVDRKEVVAGGGDPALGIRGQTSSGDDAVDVGVKAQVASPGVKDGGDTEVGAEALWITPEFEEGSGGGREEGVEDEVSIREGETT